MNKEHIQITQPYYDKPFFIWIPLTANARSQFIKHTEDKRYSLFVLLIDVGIHCGNIKLFGNMPSFNETLGYRGFVSEGPRPTVRKVPFYLIVLISCCFWQLVELFFWAVSTCFVNIISLYLHRQLAPKSRLYMFLCYRF